MSNGSSEKKLGFASFFATPPDSTAKVANPAKSPPSLRPVVSFSKALEDPTSISAAFSVSKEVVPARTAKHTSQNGRHTPGKPNRSHDKPKRCYKCLGDPELDKTIPKGTKAKYRYDGQAVN